MAKRPASRKRTAAKAKTSGKKTVNPAGHPAQSSRLKVRATPTDTSDRNHLISVIQAGTGSSKKAAKETLDALLNTVTLSLKRNKKVQLTGFGAFSVAKRRAHRGRNPRTGEAIRVKASKRVRFKAGRKLKGGI